MRLSVTAASRRRPYCPGRRPPMHGLRFLQAPQGPGFTRQRAGALECVRHGRLHGRPWERSPSPLAQPRDKAGRAVELPRLSAAPEEAVQRFPREVLIIRGHRPSQQSGPHPFGPRSCSDGASTT